MNTATNYNKLDSSSPIWVLNDGIRLAREIETCMNKDYHVAIGGSVLIKGQSNKDVDIFLYPHNTKSTLRFDTIFAQLNKIGIKVIEKLDFNDYDDKDVWQCEYNNKRVDIFIVK